MIDCGHAYSEIHMKLKHHVIAYIWTHMEIRAIRLAASEHSLMLPMLKLDTTHGFHELILKDNTTNF
jgi:hypothetical protein